MDNIEIFKKWRKSASSAGFITVYNWTYADRVAVEIAECDPKTDAIKSLSKCYIPTLKMISYLHAEVHGTVPTMYPSLLLGDKYKHGVTYFGGKGPARVFKVEDWGWSADKSDFQPSNVRRFKAGEFELKVGGNASEPDYSKPISRNSIMMRPEELAELYHHLQLTQQAYETAWMISGKTRKDFNADVEAKGKTRRSQGIYE